MAVIDRPTDEGNDGDGNYDHGDGKGRGKHTPLRHVYIRRRVRGDRVKEINRWSLKRDPLNVYHVEDGVAAV